jgi:hypothetical protein
MRCTIIEFRLPVLLYLVAHRTNKLLKGFGKFAAVVQRGTIQLFLSSVRDHALITVVSQEGATPREAEPRDVTGAPGAGIADTYPCQLSERKVKS